MAIIENKLIGNTLLVTINNPSKRNSMIIGFHDELQSTIKMGEENKDVNSIICLLYTSPSPRDSYGSRMPSSA